MIPLPITVDPGENRPEFLRQQRAYERHIAARRKLMPVDLRRFFLRAFFHDGQIRTCRIDPRRGRAVLVLGAPNFYRPAAGAYGKPIEFTCTLSGIALAACQGEPPLGCFLYPYVDTLLGLPEIRSLGQRGRYHSLAIETQGGGRLGFVFERIRVRAQDPKAWKAVLQDRSVEIPLDPQDRRRELERLCHEAKD